MFKKTLRNLKVSRCRKKHYILQIKIPHSHTMLFLNFEEASDYAPTEIRETKMSPASIKDKKIKFEKVKQI